MIKSRLYFEQRHWTIRTAMTRKMKKIELNFDQKHGQKKTLIASKIISGLPIFVPLVWKH